MPLLENDETTLPWDEIMLLPFPKPQDGKKTLPEDHLVPQEHNRGIWKSLSASATQKYDNFFESWATYASKPWNMCLLLVLGVAFAVCHHLFYSSLDGNEASNQSLMLRYGTLLAFFAKASFGTSAAMAFQQRAWLVVRHKIARLETIDSIFTANSNILSLLTWSSIKKAKIATLIALYCWITPLVVVLTSETLSVVGTTRTENGECPNIRTLNFSNEFWSSRDNKSNGGRFRMIDDYDIYSVSYWNTTALSTDTGEGDPDVFEYYGGTNRPWDAMIGARAIRAKEPLVRKESGLEICSKGWNCSYILDFTAPGYKCEELASGVDSKVKALGGVMPPFDTSILAPTGNFTYYAKTTIGDYVKPQIASYLRGRPIQKPPYPKNLGAFRTEPIMWIGYSTIEDYSKRKPMVPGEDDWDSAYTPVIIGCEHWEVNYTIRFNWTGEAQSHEVLNRTYLRKVVNTTLTTKLDPDKRLNDRTSAVPESNYVLPRDVAEYRLIAAYHSLGKTFRNFLYGWSRAWGTFESQLVLTPLIDRLNGIPTKSFMENARDLYETMIISLFSDPSLFVVAWASTGNPSGMATSDPSSKRYPCCKTRNINVFKYNKTQLLSVYGASIALATAAVMLGLHACWEEGKMRDMKPSSIIEVSRASDLHATDNKNKVKIGYGLVQNEAGRSVRSFGVEGNLTQPGRQWY